MKSNIQDSFSQAALDGQSAQVEHHPLAPFMPPNARLLMLGSFPPQRKRWSIDFYYPNFNNDMWRIMGWLFHGEKDYFIDIRNKRFHKTEIVEFLTEKGIALYDTATVIRRLKDNAADQFLEVVEATDLSAMLCELPECRAIAVTGQKAMDTLRSQFVVDEPSVGRFAEFLFGKRTLRLYRMPSSSRAYPLKLERKAEMYGVMLKEVKIL